VSVSFARDRVGGLNERGPGNSSFPRIRNFAGDWFPNRATFLKNRAGAAKKTLPFGMLAAIKLAVRPPRMIQLMIAAGGVFLAMDGRAEGLVKSEKKFVYKDSSGKITSVRVIRRYWRTPIVHPLAKVDPRIDSKLCRAATIAQERANAHSRARCWHYVKEALIAAGVISSYPQSAYAYEAGDELSRVYGFKKLAVRDPYAAPLGSILVYGGRGHVEIRTKDGFASDYYSKERCFYPLVAVYGKFSSQRFAARD
jgi:hypothetical protein